MSEEITNPGTTPTPDTTQPPETTQTPDTTQPPVEGTNNMPTGTNDNDVSKMIDALEKDMLLQKENNYKEFKTKFDEEYNAKFENKDKEIAALKEQIGKIDESYKEATKKIIDDYKDEIKSKFDNIESELSTRKSAVAKSDNPFKKDNAKYDGDWFENPNLTEEDKGMMFAKYISGNK